MEKLKLQVADGSSMLTYVSRPNVPTASAVVLLQEAFGVNQNIKSIAQKLSQLGYLVIAPEIYHRTAAEGFTCGYHEFNTTALPHFSAITAQGLQLDVQACYNWLVETQNCTSVASLGYCMGGRASYIANASVPLSCAISYYGGRIAPDHLHLAEAQKSPLLFFWGGRDQHITNEHVQQINQALTKAKKNFTCVQFAEADHGFSCDERASFHPLVSRQAWALTVQFLKDYNTTSR